MSDPTAEAYGKIKTLSGRYWRYVVSLIALLIGLDFVFGFANNALQFFGGWGRPADPLGQEAFGGRLRPADTPESVLALLVGEDPINRADAVGSLFLGKLTPKGGWCGELAEAPRRYGGVLWHARIKRPDYDHGGRAQALPVELEVFSDQGGHRPPRAADWSRLRPGMQVCAHGEITGVAISQSLIPVAQMHETFFKHWGLSRKSPDSIPEVSGGLVGVSDFASKAGEISIHSAALSER